MQHIEQLKRSGVLELISDVKRDNTKLDPRTDIIADVWVYRCVSYEMKVDVQDQILCSEGLGHKSKIAHFERSGQFWGSRVGSRP